MGVIPPPPQDSPPPNHWIEKNRCGWKSKEAVTSPTTQPEPFFKQYKKRPHSLCLHLGMKRNVTQPHHCVRTSAKSCCLSTPLQQLSSSELKTTVRGSFSDHGKERYKKRYLGMKRIVTQPHHCVRTSAKSCCLSTPLQQLSSSELKTTVHGSFSDHGKERVHLFEAPLNHLLPSKSAPLISLTTLWVNILLRKVVKIKHFSWNYVLHILNGEPASITFDQLFKMSIRSSQEDVATQVFTSVLQNESLQDELFHFLKAFAQTCIAKWGVLPLQDLKVTISSDIMETSGLKAEFETLMKGEYERVLRVYTNSDSQLGEPPHLTAYLTVSVDGVHISDKLSGHSKNSVNLSLENCKAQHLPRASSRGKSTAMDELQAGDCPTPVTSTTSSTASNGSGSRDPSTQAMDYANKKPQALKKDPGIEVKTSNIADDQNHGDIPKYESSQPKHAVENLYWKCMCVSGRYTPEGIINCKPITGIQNGSLNSSITGAETESVASFKYSGITWNPKQPHSIRKERCGTRKEQAASCNKPTHPSSGLPPSLKELSCDFCQNLGGVFMLHMLHHLCGTSYNIPFVVVVVGSHSMQPSTAMYGHTSLPLHALCEEYIEKLPWHAVKNPATQIPEADSWDSDTNVRVQLLGEDLVHHHHLKARKGIIGKLVMEENLTKRMALPEVAVVERENGSVNETMLSSQPQSWTTDILRYCSSLASLKSFIQSLPPEVLTRKDVKLGMTLCHALVGLCEQGFTSSEVIHLFELFEERILQQCMLCQDSSGNTPLHCSVDVQNANNSIVKFLLRFTSCESLLILNNDNLTPLELSFEKSLWFITQLLIQHQIETGAHCAAELLQKYVLKAVVKEGGAYFLSQLLNLRDQYCPDLDLNFGSCESSRTPWWYLVNSTTDVTVMRRVLQALKDHSIEFKSLLTRTDGETNLVDQAMEENKVLFSVIQRVAGWQYSEEDLGSPDKGGCNISGSSETLSQTSSYTTVPLARNDQSSSDQDVTQLEQVRLQLWLSQSDGESLTDGRDCHIPLDSSSSDQFQRQRTSIAFHTSSGGKEVGGQRMPNKGKTIFRQPKTALFRNISSSGSEVECYNFSDPAQRSFPALAGKEESEFPPDILPSEANTMRVQEQYFESTTELQSPGEPSNISLYPAQTVALTPLLAVLPEDTSQSSSESFSEGGGTSVEADDSSDGVAGGTLPKVKRPVSQLRRKCKKTIPAIIPAVRRVPHVTTKGKKGSLVVLHQRSGYSGDDNDHRNECNKMKSSRFTRAQRAAGIMRKERLYSTSSSECSEGEIEKRSAQIWDTEDAPCSNTDGIMIRFTIDVAICKFQLLNSTDHLSQMSSSTFALRKSTELHHAVRRECLQSVQHILTCDGGEDQIQIVGGKGYTPLEIASQNRDLTIFELLLENLVCSQTSPSVTLPPCFGRQQVTLMTSIVKVLSKLEIEFCPSTLHRMMLGCHHWDLPMVVHVTPSAVLTTIVLLGELLWTYRNQTVMDEVFSCLRGGIKKKKSIKSSQKQTTQEQTTQEQETPFQSEMVSDTREFDILVFYRSAGINSLVTGITLTRNKGFESHQRQTRTYTGTPLHQPSHSSDASAARKAPNSINPTPSPGATDSTLPRVAADSPSYSQLKSPVTKLFNPKQVSKSTDAPLDKDSDVVTAWQAWIEKAVDCLHAGYYSQMLEVLKFGKVPPSLPPKIAMEAQFGCALAYYKLDKHNEAAKHLESLKTIASSAQSFGNESIASVYLGDIEFTQSRYTEAAKHYSHALELYRGDDNIGKEYKLIVPTFSAVSAKLGSAFRNASKVVDAVQAYRRAIATADSKKDELSAHTSLGNLFQSVGENASALAEYEHSIRLSEELKDHVSLGWAYGNMGNAYLGLYQRDKGLNYLTKALDLTVKHEPTPQAISRAYNNLGTAHQALNELDKAEENYDLALGQSIYGNDIPGQARVYGNIGNVLMLRKDYERSIPHYTEVLHLSKDRSTVSTAFHNRGCSYYEWAESKKETLFQKDASSVKKDQFFLNGPDFKDCEGEHQPPLLPNSILKYYQQGRQDLEEVVKYHEETFDNIKGSSKGLTLSVSLFETNSRTFHRLQDCLVNLEEWEMALVVAEQSRTRTLGELLVKRKGWQINHPLTTPLNLETISDVVKSQHSIVVYLSYTGARLLGWVLAPKSSKISVSMFEVPLEDDQFEGKSFDYHLRYNLTEVLVERSFEMYRAVDYQSELNEPVRKLYRLVGKPLMKIFKELKEPDSTPGVQDIVIVPDSYTNLLPFPCLLADEDEDGGGFLGDSFTFRIMPSLLTMGIVDQLPCVVVQVPADSQNMCVVGNPTIPTFMYNGEKCNLGKLPFATREAEWVANTLKTTPILHEQATKNAVLMRIMNAKVIHMATHGNASAGFLAFAGMSSRNGAAEAKNVLLYPEDIEILNISPALVVLSSCDSARGTVKADGILGMARAFILAGAQAVLTTLWRVPDESASVFMQFFYQYLMDGLKASLALQKATLSLRCFSKYSQYIHWSGYQLTGREIQFDITKPSTAAALEARLGKSSVFPRLEVVKQLESAFLKDPHAPTDVQILRGSPALKPSEALIDFIHSFHHAFTGGIFWINGRSQELIDASAAYVKQVTGTVPTASQTRPLLIIFDCIDQIPRFPNSSTSLMALLRNSNTHIVVISKNYAPPDDLLKEVDRQLLRGCKIIDVEPLSMIHTTQRIVHSVLKAHHLAPTNDDQNFFEKLAEFTSGSPALTDVATALLLSEVRHDSQDEPQDIRHKLMTFKDQLSLDKMGPSTKPVTVVSRKSPEGTAIVREISKNVYDHIDSIKETEQDLWCTSSTYDSWQAVAMLVDQCSLTAEEKLLLFAISMFSCSPILMSMVTEVSSMIAKASQKLHISTSLHSKLFQMHLMKRYPLPVIMHPSLNTQKQSTEPEFVYMPQVIARAIWKDMMSPRDRAVALSTSYMALRTLADNASSSDVGWGFIGGLCSLLLEVFELNYELMGKKCYQEVYKLYLRFHVGEKQSIGAQKIQFPDPP